VSIICSAVFCVVLQMLVKGTRHRCRTQQHRHLVRSERRLAIMAARLVTEQELLAPSRQCQSRNFES
jgi:hypothetical protein